MKIYEEYTKVIAKYGKVKKAYFTTFNLSPIFFEYYLLPPLVGEDIPDNDYILEDVNSSFEKSKLELKVFYDANMYNLNENKRTVVNFHPILFEKGLFHPKVIYLEFEEECVLFVGSGNITVSGWGRNIEAFKIVNFKKKSVLFQQVYNFFIDVELLAGIRKNNTKKKIVYRNEKLDFIYSFNQEKIFIEALNLDKNLYVYSPYFSDLEDILNYEPFKNLESISVIPDLINGNKMRVSKIYEEKRVKYLYSAKAENIKMNHSKVWLSDSKLAIGSYNFTKEAIEGINFEAALIEDISLKDIENLPSKSLDDLTSMDDIELGEESLKIINKYKALFELKANWKERTLSLKEIFLMQKFNKLKLILPSNLQLTLKESILELTVEEKEQFFRALVNNKIFKVLNGNNVIFEGVILEEKTKDYREIVKVETLDDVFSSFIDSRDPLNAKYMKSKSINYDMNIDETNNLIKSSQNFLNYFNLFMGIKNMKIKLETMSSQKNIRQFCFNASNSISAIKYVIDQNREDTLFIYIFIDELNELIQLANKKLKETSIKLIENVNIKLLPGDKKFIEEMKK